MTRAEKDEKNVSVARLKEARQKSRKTHRNESFLLNGRGLKEGQYSIALGFLEEKSY